MGLRLKRIRQLLRRNLALLQVFQPLDDRLESLRDLERYGVPEASLIDQVRQALIPMNQEMVD